ncbi:MAG: hypothetical protein KF841_10265 [Phycisphaerae bacterium]|nr:hypothetical protein [Phycisphaerae bacterium]
MPAPAKPMRLIHLLVLRAAAIVYHPRSVTYTFLAALLFGLAVSSYFVFRGEHSDSDSGITSNSAPARAVGSNLPHSAESRQHGLSRPAAQLGSQATNFAAGVEHRRGDPPAAPPADRPKPSIEFGPSLAQLIHDRGHITVTVHIALYDDGRKRHRAFGDGVTPVSNMYWGARFGVETHMVKDAGWQRVYADEGTGGTILSRIVLRKRIEPTAAWRARSVEAPFDLYLLALAWPQSNIVEAMNRPLQEALCGETTFIRVDGQDIAFGAESVLVGYLGQNRMLTQYWDPFTPLADCPPPARQIGVFYIAPRSAVLLHRPAEDYGLYSALFARESITPEAYVLSGMLAALESGEIDDAFLRESAKSYAKYQKSVTPQQAGILLIR